MDQLELPFPNETTPPDVEEVSVGGSYCLRAEMADGTVLFVHYMFSTFHFPGWRFYRAELSTLLSRTYKIAGLWTEEESLPKWIADLVAANRPTDVLALP